MNIPVVPNQSYKVFREYCKKEYPPFLRRMLIQQVVLLRAEQAVAQVRFFGKKIEIFTIGSAV